MKTILDGKFLKKMSKTIKTSLRQLIRPIHRVFSISLYSTIGHIPIIKKTLKWKNKLINRLGRRGVKWLIFGLSLLVVVGTTLGIISYHRSLVSRSYDLPVNEQALIGRPDSKLLSHYIYDTKDKSYYLYKSAIGANSSESPNTLPSSTSVTVGAKYQNQPAFSLKLPINSNQGITTYDDHSGLSFSLVPEFSTLSAKQVLGNTVYPIGIGGPKDVYTIKANGLQENIIFNSAPKGTIKLAYKLILPDTLQAKMMAGGNIGIYSANPYLFGNISYGSAADQTLVAKARANSQKTNLVFVLPAPLVTDDDGLLPSNIQRHTDFTLNGDILTLLASDLSGIHGPISIDPSVVVASASAFGQGNNEGDILFGTSSVSEAGLSGGALSGATCTSNPSWCESSSTATGSLPVPTEDASAVVYNGYIYSMGGQLSATVDYAHLNSTTGALEAPPNGGCSGTQETDWCYLSSSLPSSLWYASSVAYNGYIYYLGGMNSGYNATPNVDYALLNANGSLGAPSGCTGTQAAVWCESSSTASTGFSLPEPGGYVGTYYASAVAYNGYIYLIGGQNNSGTNVAIVDYALLNANGSLGAPSSSTCSAEGGTEPDVWCMSSSTANSGFSLPANISEASAVVYNGFIYFMGGFTVGTYSSTVDYVQLNTGNGSLGAPSTCAGTQETDWCESTSTSNGSLPTGADDATAAVYNGYIYFMGGLDSGTTLSSVYYAPIYTGGSIGSWSITTSLPTATQEASAVVYNGYLYLMGGTAGGSEVAIVNYAQISSPGDPTSWASSSTAGSGFALPSVITLGASAVYNGYIYFLGGDTSGTIVPNVDYAVLNANGSLSAPSSSVCTGDGGSEPDVWCESSGATGSDFSLPTGRQTGIAAVYNGYIYFMGGYTNGLNIVGTVDYAVLNANGSLSAPSSSVCTGDGGSEPDVWCESSGNTGSDFSLPSATEIGTGVVYNGYIYYIGGYASGSGYTAVVDYAVLNANGSLSAPSSGCAGTEPDVWCESSLTSNGSLPVGTADASAAVYNGYIYFMGGYTGSSSVATVDYVALNASNGSLKAPPTCTGGTQETDWCESNYSLPTATYVATAVAYNGFIYLMGGYTSGPVATVDYAVLNANGSLSAPSICAGTLATPWCELSSSLPAATYQPTAVAYNGYIYFMGGNASGDVATVDYSLINNGGPGTVPTWTASSTTQNTGFSLPTSTGYASSAVYNGFIYFMGGFASSQVSTVDYALLNTNGSLRAPPTCAGTQETDWCESISTASGNLPTATDAATGAVYNGYLYFMGGYTGSAYVSTVDYTVLNANGSLAAPASGCAGTIPTSSDWCESTSTATGSLPTATDQASGAVYNGFIYFMGGLTGPSAWASTVDYAKLNANGSLGAPATCPGSGSTQETDWCESSTSANTGFGLTVGTMAATGAVYNGFLYFMGGFNGLTDSDVYYVALSANGSLVAPSGCAGTQETYWCELTSTSTGSLPIASYAIAGAAYNGYLYLMGGFTGSTVTTVYYAPIYNGGGIGSWSTTTSLPTATEAGAGAVYNGFVYFMGGYDGSSNFFPTVDYAPLYSTPRIGFYSSLIDLSGSSTEDSNAAYLVFDGTNTGVPGIGGLSGPGTGGIFVNYQFGSNACTTLNTSSYLTATPLILATPYVLSSSSNGCSSSSDTNYGRWVWVTIKLDDSQTATFPDSSSNHATISGFTLYYHPASNGRLRGGATFSNGSLQSLDTPP